MSKIYTLNNSLWLKADLNLVWAFGSTPKNLAAISPGFLNLKISAPREGCPQNQDLVVIRIRPFGLFPIVWESRILDLITEGDKRQFVDLQERGPFKFWKHTHRFEKGRGPNGEEGVWVYDDVEYSLPFSFFGKIGHMLFLKHMLSQMFYDRNKAFLKEFS